MLYVLSASYDVKLNAVILKLYNDETEKIEEWSDVEYKAYFLAKEKMNLNGIYNQEQIIKYDALNDKNTFLWKVEMDTPALIRQTNDLPDVYENNLMFILSYIYDKNIKMGMPYIHDGASIKFKEDPEVQNRISDILNKLSINEDEKENYKMWAELMEYPAPHFKRVSLDIEVWNEDENKIAVPEHALNPVIAVCMASNNEEKIALILARDRFKFEHIPSNIYKMEFFNDESELLLRTFELINEYPIILTFNGDGFDLPYLYFRAIRLGIDESKIPIEVKINKKTNSIDICMLKNGIHIDLYKFFSIKAMKVYAFANKYKDVGLDEVSKALLNRGKIPHTKKFNDLTYEELSEYCMNDALLTLDLSTYDENIVMNLILMVQRISRLPIENSSRKNVGSWIKNFMTYEHRRRNYLIPSASNIRTLKGTTESSALIKGKKYKGAIVFDPKTGIHFIVFVLDFASLYPSIFKNYNIGYATVNCPHEECKDNTVGELKHWICKKNKSIESQLIGSLRDLRVFVYKKKAKDKQLVKALMNWYKVAEQSIKVIMNASYGVLGDDKFVYYCPPSAEEVTAIARYIISSTANKAQEIGLCVIYGDTDSIFIENPDITKLNSLIMWTKEKFGIDFEIDKIYRYACLSNRKKNYFGVKEDGEIDIKGLTGKKKHTPKIFKDAFNETKKILSEIHNEKEMEEGKIKIIKLLKNIGLTLKRKEWVNMKDIAFNVTMNKNISEYIKNVPQHVRAAKMLNNKGYNVSINNNISYIKISRKETFVSKTGKKSVRMVSDIKPLELAIKEEVDINKYIEFFESIFAQILEPMNVDFEKEILGITKMSDWLNKSI